MKRLYEGRVSHPGEPYDGEQLGMMDAIRTLGMEDTSASRAFLLEGHDVKEWIITGKLERILDSFLAGHELPNRKHKASTDDLAYKLDHGLTLHAYQVPREELKAHTDKYVLSIELRGIDPRNVDEARRIFGDLRGIPV